MRLIDADELKKMFMYAEDAEYAKWSLSGVISEIDDMPTVCDLEQIRAEIDGIEINGQVDEHTMFIRSGVEVKKMALEIIDKYKEQTDAKHKEVSLP